MNREKLVIKECITINTKIDSIIKKLDKFISDVETDDRLNYIARDSLIKEASEAKEKFKNMRCD